MDRRKFLKGTAIAVASTGAWNVANAEELAATEPESAIRLPEVAGSVDGHTLVCSFARADGSWKVYEDLRERDGAMTFVSPAGKALVLPRRVEANFAGPDPLYLGLKLSDIGMTGADLLADGLLAGGGDPDPAKVASIAPPIGSPVSADEGWPPFNTFLGTVACLDTLPVFPSGFTLTYHHGKEFGDLRHLAPKRHEGLTGGWMPCPRKVMVAKDGGIYDVMLFGDVNASDRFIVQTWHRTVLVRDGRIVKIAYGRSYPAYPPARKDPTPDEFYSALLDFALYWQRHLASAIAFTLPDASWVDMSRHAFVKELMVRPGGTYPKYGAVDRAYYGSEYDGFQDVFTSSLYANLEWGRFAMAAAVFDNYFSDFVDDRGAINMRGPETAQYGMMLSLVARYLRYTGDTALVVKHRGKIEAIAGLLLALHDESLAMPASDVGHGLIHGWNESDACLSSTPEVWWKPYFANSAFAARGLEDLSAAWMSLYPQNSLLTAEWGRRAATLRAAVAERLRDNIRHDLNPPYIGPLPGAKLTFWESMSTEKPSPQQWAHRAYSELLQADVLPPDLANTVIDCMRAYGATTAGVVANVEVPHPEGRNILGFISYGYAQALLRLDRIEEYLLFLYTHRYHDHSRGSWMAGEVADISGGTPLFCIPAQLTIPLLMRWMLVLEDSGEDRLHFGKGLPREWVVSGQPIAIEQAPTRWGRVNFQMAAKKAPDGTTRVWAEIGLAPDRAPAEVDLKLRVPRSLHPVSITVNGREQPLIGVHGDVLRIATAASRHFEIVAHYA